MLKIYNICDFFVEKFHFLRIIKFAQFAGNCMRKRYKNIEGNMENGIQKALLVTKCPKKRHHKNWNLQIQNAGAQKLI